MPVASHELRERRVRCDCRLSVKGQQIIYEVVVGVAEIVVILISDEPCRIRESAGGSINEQITRKIFVRAVRLERFAYWCAGRAERAELCVDKHIRLVNAVVIYRDGCYRVSHAHADCKTVLLLRFEPVAETDLNIVVVVVGELCQSRIFVSGVGIESFLRVFVVFVRHEAPNSGHRGYYLCQAVVIERVKILFENVVDEAQQHIDYERILEHGEETADKIACCVAAEESLDKQLKCICLAFDVEILREKIAYERYALERAAEENDLFNILGAVERNVRSRDAGTLAVRAEHYLVVAGDCLYFFDIFFKLACTFDGVESPVVAEDVAPAVIFALILTADVPLVNIRVGRRLIGFCRYLRRAVRVAYHVSHELEHSP